MKRILLDFAAIFVLAACNAPVNVSPSPTIAIPPPPTETVTPEPTSTATPQVLEVEMPDSSTIVLDFVAAVCTAEWSNNGEYLPCPGDPNDTGAGYVQRLDHTIISGNILVESPSLITIPAYDRLA
ncbi:MAG: hypothetical protein P8Z41_10250, partial [Anaerolineales bacterium]